MSGLVHNDMSRNCTRIEWATCLVGRNRDLVWAGDTVEDMLEDTRNCAIVT